MMNSEHSKLGDLLPLLLLAGIPGCGKTTVASHLSRAAVVSMDDFYLAFNDPRVPHRYGFVDWEALAALNIRSLQISVEKLLRRGVAKFPTYDMRQSKPSDPQDVDAKDACVVVVEGVHAFDLQVDLPVSVSRVLLISPNWQLIAHRFRRDVQEKRFTLIMALFRTVSRFFRYRNYNYYRAQHADHILRYQEHPVKTALDIKRLTQYWRNCE